MCHAGLNPALGRLSSLTLRVFLNPDFSNTRHLVWIVYWGCVSQPSDVDVFRLLRDNLYPCKSQLFVITLSTCVTPDTKTIKKTPFKCGQKICGNVVLIYCSSEGTRPRGKASLITGFIQAVFLTMYFYFSSEIFIPKSSYSVNPRLNEVYVYMNVLVT